MPFDAEAWMREIRDLAESGLISARGTARDVVRAALEASFGAFVHEYLPNPRADIERRLQHSEAKDLTDSHVEALLVTCRKRWIHIGSLTDQAQRVEIWGQTAAELPPRAGLQVLQVLWRDCVELVDAMGIGEKNIELAPVLYMSAQDFADLQLAHPQLSRGMAAAVVRARPTRWRSAADNLVLDAKALIEFYPTEFTLSEAIVFAHVHTRDTFGDAAEAVETMHRIVAKSTVFDLAAARAIALGRRDPEKFAVRAERLFKLIEKRHPELVKHEITTLVTKRAHPLTDAANAVRNGALIAEHFPRLSGVSRTIALKSPDDPLGAADKVERSRVAIVEGYPEMAPWAIKLAFKNQNNPLAAAEDALKTSGAIQKEFPVVAPTYAKEIAVSYPESAREATLHFLRRADAIIAAGDARTYKNALQQAMRGEGRRYDEVVKPHRRARPVTKPDFVPDGFGSTPEMTPDASRATSPTRATEQRRTLPVTQTETPRSRAVEPLGLEPPAARD